MEYKKTINNEANDVVCTPDYFADFMARIAGIREGSTVCDIACGEGALLSAALRAGASKVYGVELSEELARDTAEAMKGQPAEIINGDSLADALPFLQSCDVALLNPPYSETESGMAFTRRLAKEMKPGSTICLLIREDPGKGMRKEGSITAEVLRLATLMAVITNADIFNGKASVGTATYLFELGRPQQAGDIVTFIDFSEDGYTRRNRKKKGTAANFTDTDNAAERYKEVEAICRGEDIPGKYYTEENGKLIRDTISLDGLGLSFNSHIRINLTPTDEDFMKTVADYLAFRVSEVISGRTEA